MEQRMLSEEFGFDYFNGIKTASVEHGELYLAPLGLAKWPEKSQFPSLFGKDGAFRYFEDRNKESGGVLTNKLLNMAFIGYGKENMIVKNHVDRLNGISRYNINFCGSESIDLSRFRDMIDDKSVLIKLNGESDILDLMSGLREISTEIDAYGDMYVYSLLYAAACRCWGCFSVTEMFKDAGLNRDDYFPFSIVRDVYSNDKYIHCHKLDAQQVHFNKTEFEMLRLYLMSNEGR